MPGEVGAAQDPGGDERREGDGPPLPRELAREKADERGEGVDADDRPVEVGREDRPGRAVRHRSSRAGGAAGAAGARSRGHRRSPPGGRDHGGADLGRGVGRPDGLHDTTDGLAGVERVVDHEHAARQEDRVGERLGLADAAGRHRLGPPCALVEVVAGLAVLDLDPPCEVGQPLGEPRQDTGGVAALLEQGPGALAADHDEPAAAQLVGDLLGDLRPTGRDADHNIRGERSYLVGQLGAHRAEVTASDTPHNGLEQHHNFLLIRRAGCPTAPGSADRQGDAR